MPKSSAQMTMRLLAACPVMTHFPPSSPSNVQTARAIILFCCRWLPCLCHALGCRCFMRRALGASAFVGQRSRLAGGLPCVAVRTLSSYFQTSARALEACRRAILWRGAAGFRPERTGLCHLAAHHRTTLRTGAGHGVVGCRRSHFCVEPVLGF